MSNLISISLSADSSKLLRGFTVADQVVTKFSSTVTGLVSRLRQADQEVKNLGLKSAAATAGMVVAMGSAAKAAGDLQAVMNNFGTLSAENAANIGAFTDEVLKMSTQLPQSATELASGLYDIASSGVEANGQMEVLEASAEAASAGLTSTAVSARAITAAMNAYGMSASDATEISDIFFATVNAGVITFEEFSMNIGDWIGLASNLGVELEDASAALATITLSGVPAAQAATDVARVFQSMIEPTTALSDAYSELGVASGVELVEKYGTLQASLDAIIGVTGDEIEVLSELFNNVNALEGALGLLANEGENWNGVLEIMENRTGATANALEIQSQGMNQGLKMFGNSITRLRTEIGQYYVPVISAATREGAEFLNVISDLPGPIKATIAVMGALVTIATSLGALLLLKAVRTRLYIAALKQLPPELLATRTGTIAMTVAQDGLIRSMVKGTVTATEWAVVHTRAGTAAEAMALKANRAAMGMQNFSSKANAGVLVVGALTTALTFGLEAMSEFGSSSAEAEAKAQGLFDQSNLEAMRGSVDQIRSALEDATAAEDSYYDNLETRGGGANAWSYAADAVTTFGEAAKIALPFVESGLNEAQQEQEAYNAMLDEASQKTGAYSDVVYGLVRNFEISEAQAEAFLASQDPELINRISTAYQDLYDPDAFDNEAWANEINSIEAEAIEMFNTFVANGGVMTDFEDQLGAMEGEFADLIPVVMELTDVQKEWQSALEAIGAADFAGVLQEKQEQIREMGRAAADGARADAQAFLEAEENRNQALRDSGAITEEQYQRMQDASREAFEAMQGDSDQIAESFDAMAEAAELSIDDYATALEEANQRLEDWRQDMFTVAQRAGGGTEEMRDQIVGYLRSMGEDGAHLASLLADATDEEFMRMSAAILENVESTGPTAAVEMDGAMQIIEAAARTGASNTAAAIAEELGVGVSVVREIALEYGRAISDGVNPILVALGETPIVILGQAAESHRRPGSGPFAEGGLRLPNQATYMPAQGTGGLVQWAEAETEGEYFIPRARSKRDRSTMLLQQVAGDFGFALLNMKKMADGGWLNVPNLTGEFGEPIDRSAEMAMAFTRDAAIEYVKRAFFSYIAPQPSAQPPQTGGGGSNRGGSRINYDDGGWLYPGLTHAYNGTGFAEYVNPDGNMSDAMDKIARNLERVARQNKNITQHIQAGDHTLPEILDEAQQRASFALSTRGDGS